MHLNFEWQKNSKEFILMGRTMTNSRRGTQEQWLHGKLWRMCP